MKNRNNYESHENWKKEVSQDLIRLGFEEVSGVIMDHSGVGNHHEWYKRDGVIVDLDARKFHPGLSRIYIGSEKSQKTQEQYLEGVVFSF